MTPLLTTTDGDVLYGYDINRMNEAIESNFMARKAWRFVMNEESTLANKKERQDYLKEYYQGIVKKAKRIEHKEYALNMLKSLL